MDICSVPSLAYTATYIAFLACLTLVYMEESLGQLAGEQWLWKVPEELLDHVGHVVGRLVLVAHEVRRRLALLPQGLDTRLHARLPEQPDLGVK